MVADEIVNFSRYISPEIAAAGLPELQAARADLRSRPAAIFRSSTKRCILGRSLARPRPAAAAGRTGAPSPAPALPGARSTMRPRLLPIGNGLPNSDPLHGRRAHGDDEIGRTADRAPLSSHGRQARICGLSRAFGGCAPLAARHELEMLNRIGDVDRGAVDGRLCHRSIEKAALLGRRRDGPEDPPCRPAARRRTSPRRRR